jgi:hypothetical protein
MAFVGLFFLIFGSFTLLQARLPRHQRKIFPGRAGSLKKGRQPLGRYSCIGMGGGFFVIGLSLTLAGFGIVKIEPAMLLLGSIPPFLLMIAGVIADDLKKEPNQPTQPTPSGRG